MKKIAALSAALVFFLTGCRNSGADSFTELKDMKNISAKPHRLEEYYVKKELLADDYLYVENFRCIDDKYYYTGRKMQTDVNKCMWQSSADRNLSSVDLKFPYTSIWDACFADDRLYILYDEYLSEIDVQNGEVLKTELLAGECIQIVYYNERLYMLSFNGTMFCCDKDLNKVSETEISDITDADSEDILIRQFLINDDGLYLWGNRKSGNEESEIPVLLVYDQNFNLKYQREYADLSGMAYEIYEDREGIVLVTLENNDDFTVINSLIDIISPEDGAVKEWYEVPDAQFIYWNYDENKVIGKGNEGTFVYDLKDRSKKTVGEQDGFLGGRVSEADGIFFSFSGYDENIITSFSSVSCSGEKNEHQLEENMPFSGVDETGRFYTAEIGEDGDGFIKFYSDDMENQVKLSTGSSLIDMDLFFCCTENRIYNVSVDQNNQDNILVFDGSGNLINTISTEDGTLIMNAAGSSDSAYMLADTASGEREVLRITDEGSEKVNIPESLSVDRVYAGDDEYDFYFSSGVVIYGYSIKGNKTERIMNYVDSGMSSEPELFVKTGEEKYACSTDEGIAVYEKADQETLDRMNSRKIIYAAGDKNSLNEDMMSRIVEFNRNSMDYFIVSKNYSADMSNAEGKLISEFYDDIIRGNIPDIYLLNSSFDYSFLKKSGGFLNLDEKEFSDSEIFENASCLNGDNGEIYGAASSFIYTGIRYNGDEDIFRNGCTYDEFLETAEKYNLKFSDTDPMMLYYYFVVCHADDFINPAGNSCSFNSDTFVSMLEYIKDACSDDGELVLTDFFNVFDFAEADDIRLFDFSENGKSRGRISRYNSMAFSSYSDVTEGVKQFAKMFFDEEYQENIYNGIPASKQAFRKAFDSDEKKTEYSENILDSSAAAYVPDGHMMFILMCEAEVFLDGRISAEELAEDIQQQAGLYLKETAE